MGVAESFGSKTEIISEMAIDPTAAYLLAAPSAPDAARETALERAGTGERITTSVAKAKEILAKARKKAARKVKAVPIEKLGGRLVKVLSRFKERWDPKEVSELARQLREFADTLEEGKGSGRKGT
jgi:hypothetical protein